MLSFFDAVASVAALVWGWIPWTLVLVISLFGLKWKNMRCLLEGETLLLRLKKGKYVSEGMIFAADTDVDGGCSIAFFPDNTPAGARIH